MSLLNKEGKSEVNAISFPVQASDSYHCSESSFKDLAPVSEEDGNKERQRTNMRGRDKQTDVRITKYTNLLLVIKKTS